MNKPSPSSRTALLVCPHCENGKLQPSVYGSVRCDSCSGCPSRAMLQTLMQIAALPDAIGAHACECGHPEMRRLPDGTYHCPACGSEVLTYHAPPIAWKVDEPSDGFSLSDGRIVLPTQATQKGVGAS